MRVQPMAIDWSIVFRVLVLAMLAVLIVIHLQLLWNQSRGVSPVLKELSAVKALAARVDPPTVETQGKNWRFQINPRGVWVKGIALNLASVDAVDHAEAPPGWSSQKESTRLSWRADSEEAESAGPFAITITSRDEKKMPGTLTVTYTVEGPVPQDRTEQFVVIAPA
jgi:hypothetical protein